MTEYVQKILSDKCNLEFFIEGTRSRVGKMLDPKYGILTMVVDAVNANMLKDAKLVPITINYEKVLEGDTFPIELLGESKVKESLGRLIKAAEVLKENYGRIYIEICEPISLRKYLSEGVRRKKPMKDIIYNLGYEIVYTLSDNLVVMPSAIVASIVLMQRRGIS
jgi:glycerol-3-phosphate O-acyltransferase